MTDDRKRKKSSRVTLNFEAPPLRLPTDPPAAPDSTEEDVAPPPAQSGEDAWSRQRPLPSVPSAALESEEPAHMPSDEPPREEGGALDLVTRRARRSSKSSGNIDHAAEMADRYALGDFTEALKIAELILGRHPAHESAQRTAKGARERLEQLYTSRLGSLSRVPAQAIESSQVRWLGLDHRAAFLFSRVDGALTIEELVDVSGMPRLEALKTLVELLELGAFRFEN